MALAKVRKGGLDKSLMDPAEVKIEAGQKDSERGLPRKKKNVAPPRLSIELNYEQQRQLKKMVDAEETTIRDYVLWKLGLLDVE
ncbi:MAG: hypothetical protein COB41_01895 [Proteobacteria bacterium]|nr:MAG: hypothetical protein COB41_01895 [Pseudomonadota bacterium]